MKLPIKIEISEATVNESMLNFVRDRLKQEINGYQFGLQLKAIVKQHIDKHLEQMVKDEMMDSPQLRTEIREAIKKELARRIRAVIALEEGK